MTKTVLSFRLTRTGVLLGALIGCHLSVFAKLGDTWDGQQTQWMNQFSASKKVYDHYTIYTYGSASNILILEYVNRMGLVFAVKWTGVTLPPMDELLPKKYLKQIIDLNPNYATKQLAIHKEGFVFRSAGRIRSFKGFALDQMLMPALFDTGLLQ